MKLKSFFANTIEEAIRLARHELGPDAMLVNSKRAGVEAQHLGCYEVVVCGEAQDTRSDQGSGSEERPRTRKAGVLGRRGSAAGRQNLARGFRT